MTGLRFVPYEEAAEAPNVVVDGSPNFDALAKVCGGFLAKGRQVAVTGRLRLNEWTNDAGERRSKLQVVADDVAFLDKPKTTDHHGAQEVPARPAVGAYRRQAG